MLHMCVPSPSLHPHVQVHGFSFALALSPDCARCRHSSGTHRRGLCACRILWVIGFWRREDAEQRGQRGTVWKNFVCPISPRRDLCLKIRRPFSATASCFDLSLRLSRKAAPCAHCLPPPPRRRVCWRRSVGSSGDRGRATAVSLSFFSFFFVHLPHALSQPDLLSFKAGGRAWRPFPSAPCAARAPVVARVALASAAAAAAREREGSG